MTREKGAHSDGLTKKRKEGGDKPRPLEVCVKNVSS
jgi:hypothetical protein